MRRIERRSENNEQREGALWPRKASTVNVRHQDCQSSWRWRNIIQISAVVLWISQKKSQMLSCLRARRLRPARRHFIVFFFLVGIFSCLLWNNVQLQPNLLDRLAFFCASAFLNDFSHRGMNVCPIYNMYHTFHWLANFFLNQTIKKRVTALILKPTYDRKPGTLLGLMTEWNELKHSHVGVCTSLLILMKYGCIYIHFTNSVTPYSYLYTFQQLFVYLLLLCLLHTWLTSAHSCVYVCVYVCTSSILPLRKNLLGSKRKAIKFR